MGAYTASERAMRVSGQPSIGSGVIFPVLESKVLVEPFAVPDHWMRIIGIDLGFDHPNAVSVLAWDNTADMFYLVDEYSEKGETLSMHANAIRAKGGDQIPVVVPHDAFKHDAANSGRKFIQILGDYGLNIVPVPFSNPPGADGKPGGNNVEFGLNFMLRAMEEGRFKVFSTLKATRRPDTRRVPAVTVAWRPNRVTPPPGTPAARARRARPGPAVRRGPWCRWP